jgi:hypothetical protein
MKTAIIFNGHLRTFDRVKDRFLEVFGGLTPDIFVSTYTKRFGYAPYIQSIQNFYDDWLIEESDILNILTDVNVIDIIIEDNDKIDEKIKEEYSSIKMKFKDFADFYSCYGQYRKLKYGIEMIKNHEIKNNFKYDMIIKTRFDLMFNKNIDLTIQDKQVLIDSGNVSPNDVFFMTYRDSMYHVVDFIYNEFFELKDLNSQIWPPHSIIASAFRSAQLNSVARPLIEYVERYKLQQRY